MSNARNWYIYLTSAISLQSFTWASISLLRQLSAGGICSNIECTALQLAILLVSFPVFLIHWLWAQRLAQNEEDERNEPLRRFYFYAILAGTLGPILANLFSLFAFEKLSQSAFIYFAVTAIPLAAVFYYHQQLLKEDAEHFPPVAILATIRRIYILGFSALGLWMAATSIVKSLQFIFQRLGGFGESIGFRGAYRPEIVRLVLGAAIWIYFWNWAQNLFAEKDSEEKKSNLRKFYLYTAVFISAFGVVGAATAILASLIRSLLSLPPSGDLGTPLSIIIGLGLVWALHAYLLHQDSLSAGDTVARRGVRRIYLYLVAAIGLAAVLVGLAGNINVLIQTATSSSVFGSGLREQAAWFIATLIAGLPVWFFPWQSAQKEASGDSKEASENRNAAARRNYLYFFLFIATITVLGSLVSVVFNLLLLMLGERTSAGLAADLAQAVSLAIIGAGLLAYHGGILRAEGRLAAKEKEKRLAEIKLTVVDDASGAYGAKIAEAIKLRFSQISLSSLGLGAEARKTMQTQIPVKSYLSEIKEADYIVAPWHILAQSSGSSVKIAKAIAQSPSKKILLPTQLSNYHWIGVQAWDAEALVSETVKAVGQALAGEEIKFSKGLGCGTIAAIIVGGIFLLILVPFVYDLFYYGF